MNLQTDNFKYGKGTFAMKHLNASTDTEVSVDLSKYKNQVCHFLKLFYALNNVNAGLNSNILKINPFNKIDLYLFLALFNRFLLEMFLPV